jgi:hypothetical protein
MVATRDRGNECKAPPPRHELSCVAVACPASALPGRWHAVDDWLRDEATNQTRFRAINESIERTTDALGLHELLDVYICECGDGNCRAPIKLTREEYEGVRSESTHFVIASDHENPEIDRVVSEHLRYAVVQKMPASAVRIARETDSRNE